MVRTMLMSVMALATIVGCSCVSKSANEPIRSRQSSPIGRSVTIDSPRDLEIGANNAPIQTEPNDAEPPANNESDDSDNRSDSREEPLESEPVFTTEQIGPYLVKRYDGRHYVYVSEEGVIHSFPRFLQGVVWEEVTLSLPGHDGRRNGLMVAHDGSPLDGLQLTVIGFRDRPINMRIRGHAHAYELTVIPCMGY